MNRDPSHHQKPGRARDRRPQPSRAQANLGYTLIEAAFTLSIVGVVLAVMVPGFLRGFRSSRVAEANENLETLAQAVASYYATAHPSPGGTRIECLPASAGPTPASPPASKSVPFPGEGDGEGTTWRAVGFDPEDPVRYRYSLISDPPGCGLGTREPPATVVLRAEGDVDDDGRLSFFERRFVVRGTQLVQAGPPRVRDRSE